MTRRPATLAQIALVDATVIATLIDAALTALDLGLQGWPETTPGASPASGNGTRECPNPLCANTTPCLTHDPDGTIVLTATERFAITTDIASRDLDALTEHIRRGAHHMAAAARLCHQWGLQGVDDTTIKAGLSERVEEIWCVSCAKAGISTVRTQGRTECRFCEEIRQKGTCGVPNPNHFAAPKGLLEIHARRRVNSADFTRCMVAAYGENWNRKLKGKRAR